MVNLQLKMLEWVWLRQDGVCAAVRELYIFFFFVLVVVRLKYLPKVVFRIFVKEEFIWPMLYVA
jgi:hypothetical protein